VWETGDFAPSGIHGLFSSCYDSRVLCDTFLRFRLIDPVRNRDRVYEVELSKGLFDEISVTIRFGRQGWHLREVTYWADDAAGAHRLAVRVLRRRLSARRRLGTGYALTRAKGASGALVAVWQRLGGADARALSVTANTNRPDRRPRQRANPPPLPLFAA
jgi:predicted DNA-binding WGR domain protein